MFISTQNLKLKSRYLTTSEHDQINIFSGLKSKQIVPNNYTIQALSINLIFFRYL